MTKPKFPPLKDKMEDIAKAASTLNKAVKSCEEWDHHDLVDQAIERIRDAQKLLKEQYESWLREVQRRGR